MKPPDPAVNKMSIYADYHIHTSLSTCASAEMTPQAIAKEAVSHGLSVVGLVYHLHPHTEQTLGQKLREQVAALSLPDGMQVVTGVEAEMIDQGGGSTLIPGLEEHSDYLMLAMGHLHLPWVKADLTQSPGDFLIRETESLLQVLAGFRVDIVAHPFNYGTLYRSAPELIFQLRPSEIPLDLVNELADTLKRKQIVLEYHCRELTERPERLGGEPFVRSYMELLDYLREKGVHFVAGSDAHYIDQIGRSKKAPVWSQNLLPKDIR